MARSVYLDHHTATRPTSASIDAMLPFFKEYWGSTTAPHQKGQELFASLNQAVERIISVLGAKPEDRFYFFSSNAEAIEHLFLSHYFDSIRHTGRNHFITTNIEEAPVLLSLKKLEEIGCASKMLSVNSQGQLTSEILEQALRPRTSLLSLSWANALTGVIHPLADLASAAHAKDVRIHVDASTIIGKIYFRFEDLPIDYLTFDGSLLHAPKGTAGLLVKEKSAFSAPISSMGGISVGGIVALAAALNEGAEKLDHLCLETARLRDKLERGIQKGFSDAKVLCKNAARLPNCTTIAFPGAASDALLFLLNRKGVYASLGGGQSQKLTHLLVASGIDPYLAHCALSFSLSYETTEDEIDYAIETIIACAHQLRHLSHATMESSHEPS
jgi:cysteine desulfurase